MSHELGNCPKLIFSRIKGYNHWMKTVISINQFDRYEVAKYRLGVINHYQQFGLKSTLNAFPVKRSTLFLWLNKLRVNAGSLVALIPQSTKPCKVRQMNVDTRIILEITRLRRKHYRLGKLKLKPLVDEYCKGKDIRSPSVSLIGKVIKRNNLFFQRNQVCHNPGRKKYSKKKKERVKNAPKPAFGGYIQADTVETYVLGTKRYTISFIDIKLKVAYSKTFKGKLSKYALETFREFQRVLPACIHTLQTDNGSEFEGVFDQYLSKQGIKHVWTYPNCPRINAVIERYNRSIQEEWMESYLHEIDDTIRFNIRLKEYLYFYNNQRVHESLGLKTPSQVIGVELKV
jgi:hypothetical protein